MIGLLAVAAHAGESLPVHPKPPLYPPELAEGAEPQWCPVVASWDDRGKVASVRAACLAPFAREAVRAALRWRFDTDEPGTATVAVPFVHALRPLPFAAPESDQLGVTGGPPPCHVVAKVDPTGRVSEAAVSDLAQCRFDPVPPVPGWGGQHGRCEGRFVLFGGRPQDWELSSCPAALRGRVISFLEGRAWAVPGEPLAVTFDLWLDPPAVIPSGTVVSRKPDQAPYVVVDWPPAGATVGKHGAVQVCGPPTPEKPCPSVTADPVKFPGGVDPVEPVRCTVKAGDVEGCDGPYAASARAAAAGLPDGAEIRFLGVGQAVPVELTGS